MKLHTKLIAVVLCVVLTLSAAPLGGFVGLDLPDLFSFKSKALSTDDYLDYPVFEMGYLMNRLQHDGTTLNGSVDIYEKVRTDDFFHRNVYSVYSDDAALMTATLAAVQLYDNNINLIAHPEHFYSVVLLDLLQSSDLQDFSVDSLKSNVVSNANKVLKETYKEIGDNLVESLGISNLTAFMNTDFSKLSESERVVLGNQLVDCNKHSMAAADVLDAVALLEVVADVGTTINSAINMANSLYSIAGYNQHIISTLLLIHYYTYEPGLKLAIENIIEIYSGLDTAEEIYETFKGQVTKYTVDNLLFITTEFAATTLLKTYLALPLFAWELGTAVTELLFDVSDVTTSYLIIKASTMIEDSLRLIMSNFAGNFRSNPTVLNAEKCKIAYNLTLTNQYYALNTVKKLAYSSFGNGSLLGMIKSLFGCQDYQMVADICDSQMGMVENRYYKWVSLAQKMYKNVYGVSFSHATSAPTVSVSSVSFERSSYTMFANEGVVNRATAYPTNAIGREIYYSSSNPSVAVVGAYGNIEAVSCGEATITATSLNGTTATCKITVLPYEATFNDGSYTIDKFIGGAMAADIPASLNGIPIVKIADEAFYDTAVTAVTIPNSVTTIGNSAFCSCDNLTSFTVPDSVTTIGNAAFSNCSRLTDIKIGNSVTTIGDSAFAYCDSLTSITIPDSVITIGEGALDGCYNLTSVVIGNGVTTSIGWLMFEDFDNLESVVIGDSVTTIEGAAFYDCDSLESVIIGNSVEYIGPSAFYQCTALKELTMPVSVTIGNSYYLHNISEEDFGYYYIDMDIYPVFEGCENIEKITLTKGTGIMPVYNRYIDSFDTIENCLLFMPWNISTSLKELVIADGVKNISNFAFETRDEIYSANHFEGYLTYSSFFGRGYDGCRGLTSITIPDSVTQIGDSAFENCSGLVSATIGGNGNIIGNSAFYNCSNLKSVTIGDGVSAIGVGAFLGCDKLTKATIGGNGNIIGNSAFKDCDMLTDVAIGSGVSAIGNGAFYDCESLTNLTINNGLTTIGNSAFYNCDGLTGISIPDSVTQIGSSAFYDCDGIINATIDGNANFIGNSAFYSCSNLKSVTIGDGVAEIGSSAFGNCVSLSGFIVDDGNEFYSSDSCGVLFNKDKTRIVQYPIGNTATTYEIPHSLTSIDDRIFYNCDRLTNVLIPDSVKSIGNYTFYDCDALINITIPDSVTSIGESAFESCDKLTEVSIGKGLAEIGNSVFENCDSLTNITISDSITAIGISMFYDCDALVSITVPDSVTSIGESAFKNCDSLTDVSIGKGVTEIGNSAFENCDALVNITIPDSVTEIGVSAFAGCDNLTNVSIGKGVAEIGNSAFYNCAALSRFTVDEGNEFYSSDSFGVLYDKSKSKIILYPKSKSATAYEIPDGVTSVADYAFYNCDNLTSTTIPDSVTTIGDYAFYDCDSLTSIIIPDSVAIIGNSAFYDCDALTGITIPDGVTSVADYAFYNCDNLISISIPDSVTSIGRSAFFDCDALTCVTIPDSVTIIGYSAFNNCSNLKSVTIEQGVTAIDDRAFCACDALTSLIIPDSVTTIGDSAFIDCDRLANVIIGNGVTTLGWSVFEDCDNLTNVTIGNKVRTIGNYAFYSCDSLTSIIIPDSVIEIPESAFEDCVNLKNIKLGSSVTSISDSAFNNCDSLTSIVIPDSVTLVRYEPFYDCDNLQSATIGKGLADKYINSAFYGCDNFTSLIFADGIETIGERACNWFNKLISVSIPDSVKTIESDAFYNCNNLEHVYYSGSVSQWKNITIGSYNTDLTSATIHYNHKCTYNEIFVEPTANEPGYKSGKCVCGSVDMKILPALGFVPNNTVNMDFTNGVISGFNVGETSLDDYADFVNAGYEWRYETQNGTLGTGSKAVVTAGNTVINEYTVVIFGDVTGDGWYDAEDAFLVNMVACGMLDESSVGELFMIAADCNHDGIVNELDVELLSNASTKLDDIDQSATQAELATNSVYLEYCSFVSQSIDINDEQQEQDSVQPEPVPEDNTMYVFSYLFDLFEKIFAFLISVFS